MGVSAWRVGRRTLLARTCKSCGELKDGPQFHPSSTGAPAWVCDRCRSARYYATPDGRQVRIKAAQKRNHRLAAETTDAATRHRRPWTSEEFDALESGMSHEEMARRFGRTYAAIENARRRMRGTHG